jgi:uncharacterized protein
VIAGRPPAPFRHVLLKLHSRCNLSCDYCYVYEHVDQSWRRQPPVMPAAVIDAAAARLADHARDWSLPSVTVTFHGGEPLLAGPDVIEYAVRSVRDAVPADVLVTFTAQTNGVLLVDDDTLACLRRNDVLVGVSVDGGPDANDRHRRFARGAGSYRAVSAGIDRLRAAPYRDLFSGLLCTVDLRNDPVEVYEDLLALDPPRMDFLLPHGNWTTPPPGLEPDGPATPYADWLIRVFDRWYDAPRVETDIRLFSAIMSLVLGGPSGTESVGLDPIDFVIVETDGSIEQGDALKTTAEGQAATGMHVFTHAFDEVLRLPGVRARQIGLAALGADCRGCRLVEVCGGGHYAHRYEAGKGFANRSVYCADLMRLIRHVYARMRADLGRLSAESSTGPSIAGAVT